MNLINLSNYHVWAGDKIREILKNLSEEDFTKELGNEFSFNSIRKLVFHSMGAIKFCLALDSEKDSDKFNSEYKKLQNLSKEELLNEWQKTDKDYATLLKKQITSEEITIPPFLGNEFTISKIDFYLQYIIHSTYHRGQIIVALKKMGKETVGTDYLFFFNELLVKK
ncbi:MAG: DUF1572 domain-containing protein [Candidatus Heimdallarchaeota archaeon]|nr:DUF1572 domain-containing protein [Candidatus Heimdallarchaeota archaeon]